MELNVPDTVCFCWRKASLKHEINSDAFYVLCYALKK